MRKMFFAMGLAFLSLFSCKGYTDLAADAFETLMTDPAAQLLDVRTEAEYAEGHLPGAVLADWNAEDFQDRAAAVLRTEHPVLVYCRSGRRSAAAAEALSAKGYKVYNLTGGYLAWTEAGKPVTIYEVERFFTDAGDPVEITLIKHGSLSLRQMQ